VKKRTRRLKASERSVRIAAGVLLDGGVVAFPTDTVYGIGVRSDDDAAVGRLYLVKERPIEKAIPLLLASAAEMPTVAREVPETAWRLAEAFWPGGLTIVLPKRETVSPAVSAEDSVAVRVPAHDVALSLIRAVGIPLATTSANISGRTSATTADEVWEELNGRIDLLLDAGECPGGIPSTVVDLTTSVPKVLRQGAISVERLRAVVGELGVRET